jgi:hypothetical protein
MLGTTIGYPVSSGPGQLLQDCEPQADVARCYR